MDKQMDKVHYELNDQIFLKITKKDITIKDIHNVRKSQKLIKDYR